MSLFTETVGLRSRAKVGTDDLNNDVYDWVETPSPAWVETGQGTEDTNRRETSEITNTVYLPLEAPVAAVSQITWNGQVWDVVGDPGVQPGGFTIDGYQQIGIKKVSG